MTATVRRKLGSDINAACGQLRRSQLEQSEKKTQVIRNENLGKKQTRA